MEEEHGPVPAAWIGAHPAYPRDIDTVTLFENWVDLRPDSIAVHSNQTTDYAALEGWANQIANALLAQDIGPGDFVGLCLDRSVEMIAGVLGILKAGAAYVPLESTFPDDRLEFMIRDAEVRIVLTDAAHSARCKSLQPPESEGFEIEALLLEQDHSWLMSASKARPLVARQPTDVAYAMYTSGSTGQPKGVCVPHRAIVRLIENKSFARFGPDEKILGLAPAGFDASTLEIWGALLHGAELHLFPSGVQSLSKLAEFLQQRRITIAWLTSALFHEMADYFLSELAQVPQLLAGGDVLSPDRVRRVLAAMPPEARLINGYGPTENTTFTCCHVMSPGDTVGESVPIGRPIANTTVHVLDPEMNPVDIGEIGELYTGGDGLARGYLNQPELTAQAFLPNPFSKVSGERLYRTGDLVRWRRTGELEFCGRSDHQIKIRGHRVELAEIEMALMGHPKIRDAVVTAPKSGSSRQLIAYATTLNGTAEPETASLRAFLATRLPDYMLPNEFVWLERLPINANGKVDRSALPVPRRVENSDTGNESHTLESLIKNLWTEILDRNDVSSLDSFFEIGANSLLALRFVEEMSRRFHIDIPPIRVFQYPTASSLAAWLEGRDPKNRRHQRSQALTAELESVAIVGMAGRFPGAENVQIYWENLCEARETISFFDPEEIEPGNDPTEIASPEYVAARGILEDGDCFDAQLFGVSPRLAQVMDPQQRVFLETAWSALEDASIDPNRYDGLIGIFGGVVHNTYQPNFLWRRPDLAQAVGTLQARLVNDKDYAPIAVAHKLNLKGPAVNVQSACSTSLVAVAQAFHALRAGQCDVALAGGAAVTAPIRSGHLHLEGGMQSVDGHTRPFDAQATGTVFSDGSGMVVLKRLSDAVRDGDTIHAVIRSAAVNNDGSSKASFTAPSVEGQADVIAMALEQANLSAEDISYVEAHGTGTPIGDPIEVEGLTQAFRETTDRNGFCALGSVKSNIGHLTAAAGVAGLIKTTLALRHRRIPATLHFEAANPEINFEKTPFFVARQTMQWTTKNDTPRRAGVSSFGVGGTNAHVILEEYWEQSPGESTQRPEQLLLISGRDENARQALETRLAEHLKSKRRQDLADVAWSLAIGRKPLPNRNFIIAPDSITAADRLHGGEQAVRAKSSPAPAEAPDIIFLFPGQGCQSAQMGRGLYAAEPVYRQALDRCAEILRQTAGWDLLSVLHPSSDRAAQADETLRQTAYTQPAIFCVEYALAQLWMSLGIRPTAMIGHSVGEFTAACLAGSLSLEAALKLVSERGRLMARMPAGSMLSVRMSAEKLKSQLPTGLSIACENSPQLSVIAGPTDQVDAFARSLEQRGVAHRMLQTSHAFHSASMDPVVGTFREAVERVSLAAPQIPIISTATGSPLSTDEATDPNYWAQHARAPVRFADALRCALDANPTCVLLEVGPRATTTTFARQTAAAGSAHRVIATLEKAGDVDQEPTCFLSAVGRLWTLGVHFDWDVFYQAPSRRRVSLPTYPFERQRHWIETKTDETPFHTGIAPLSATDDQMKRLIENQLKLIEQQINLLKSSVMSSEPKDS